MSGDFTLKLTSPPALPDLLLFKEVLRGFGFGTGRGAGVPMVFQRKTLISLANFITGTVGTVGTVFQLMRERACAHVKTDTGVPSVPTVPTWGLLLSFNSLTLEHHWNGGWCNRSNIRQPIEYWGFIRG
ncbi:MAG: hypothetical protein AAFQ35_07320 [Pseudomonadota bacterium]